MTLRALLLWIDAGPYHARACRSITARQRLACSLARKRGVVALVRRGRLGPRYVLTAAGSHEADTFTMDRDIDREIYDLRRARRVA